MRHEPGQDVNGHLAEACALGAEPFLERLLADFEAIQQVPSVENGGLLEIPRRASRCESFELGHVDIDERLIERHPIALDLENAGLGGRENASDRAQALTEALARLLLPGTAPEHGGQLAAHEALFRPYGEVGEQGLSFAGRKLQAAVARPGVKTSKESDAEASHRYFSRGRGVLPPSWSKTSSLREGNLAGRTAWIKAP